MENDDPLSPENLDKLDLPHVDEYVDAAERGGDSHPEVTADYRAGKIDFAEWIRRRGGGVMSIPPADEEGVS